MEMMNVLGYNTCSFAVLENVVFDEHTREVDYTEKTVTGNALVITLLVWYNISTYWRGLEEQEKEH